MPLARGKLAIAPGGCNGFSIKINRKVFLFLVFKTYYGGAI